MQIHLAEQFAGTESGAVAQDILRSCVHCGFCNATCPTYQLSGDELEGPRGRIYLMKTLFEQGQADVDMQTHLDSCLSCKACETTCPSGVNYHRLLDAARPEIEKVGRSPWQRLLRSTLIFFIPHATRFRFILSIGQFFRPLLANKLKRKIPRRQSVPIWPKADGNRRVLIVTGCVQKAAAPGTDQALAKLLAEQGITAQAVSGCCGAMEQHLGEEERAKARAKKNIDAWGQYLDSADINTLGEVEAIVISASGCVPQLKEYAWLLRQDPVYATKAEKLVALVKDPVELLENCDWQIKDVVSRSEQQALSAQKTAFHSPCSLSHGNAMDQRVRALLEKVGVQLLATCNDGVCCGSAGTYSLLQSEKSQSLLQNKLRDLRSEQAAVIATANIGCQLHLQSGTDTPVVHWLQLMAEQVCGSNKGAD